MSLQPERTEDLPRLIFTLMDIWVVLVIDGVRIKVHRVFLSRVYYVSFFASWVFSSGFYGKGYLVVESFMLVRDYLTRNFATLRLLQLQPMLMWNVYTDKVANWINCSFLTYFWVFGKLVVRYVLMLNILWVDKTICLIRS